MKVVDANVLLYSANENAEHHEASKGWLTTALSGADTVGFSWVALIAFIRLSTKPEIFADPFTVDEAMDAVDRWLGQRTAVVVEPAPDHSARLRRLLQEVGTGGNLVNDAHLAVLALEQRCAVVTYDNDFKRFPGVRSHRPGED